MLRQRTTYRVTRRKHFLPLLLTGLIVPAMLFVVVASIFLLPRLGSHAAGAAVNMDCILIVPRNPLTAQGLATPYQLVATNPDNGPCNEANKMQAAFVQGAVIDPATGAISIYNPLVVDKGTKPAVQPVVPTLPNGGVVALWFGFNGNNLTLKGRNGSLREGQCVNGANGTIFGQFAYCNAPNFFQVANQAIQAGKLVPPNLGTAKDGRTCPSVRDFSVVDMDQSDNVTTTYLVTGNGQTAQATTATTQAQKNTVVQTNASDNRLLDVALDGALGCMPWMAPDLADPAKMLPALPLNELQAAAHQAAPIALVPDRDPMVLNNNNVDQQKVNAYRLGVDQPRVGNANSANTTTYCTNLRQIAPGRLLLDMNLTIGQPSPEAAVANSLLTFLEQRFVATYGANGLNCVGLLGQPDPITVQVDGNGVAINGTINGVPNGNNNNGGNGNGNPPNCVINGTTLSGCTGITPINGKNCSFAFDANAKQVNVTCPAANR
jgi:hypothetical protein